jgi:hypothetical protein
LITNLQWLIGQYEAKTCKCAICGRYFFTYGTYDAANGATLLYTFDNKKTACHLNWNVLGTYKITTRLLESPLLYLNSGSLACFLVFVKMLG